MPCITVSNYKEHISKLRTRRGEIPPHLLTQTFLSLCGEEELVAVLADQREDAEGSEWRVVALTTTGVVYAIATSSEKDWDAGSYVQDGRATGWLRSRSDVVAIEVTEIASNSHPAASEWVWGVGWTARDDTSAAKFDRLLSAAASEADALGWIEIPRLDQLADAGTGALVHFECEAYIPSIVKALSAGGELQQFLDIYQQIAPLAQAFGTDPGEGVDEATLAQMGAVAEVSKTMGQNLVVVGEDESGWRVAGKLTHSFVSDSDIDGYVMIVGKVANRWPANQSRMLLALPGASLLGRKERRAAEKAPHDDDDEMYLRGPAVMLDVLAVYR